METGKLINESVNGNNVMFGSVISLSCEVTEKTYHLKVLYNDDEYFFIVQTLDWHYMHNIDNPTITSIKRGSSYWDCGKRLKNSEIKKIEQTIKASLYTVCQ